MSISIVLTTLLANLASGTPNLCDDVYLDPTGAPYTDSQGQTLARYCEWTGPGAPVWNANVCCSFAGDSASCQTPDRAGRCATGLYKMYCRYAEADADGGVVCYQPFPSACEAGVCVQAPELLPPSQEGLLCCSGGACQSVHELHIDFCEGAVLWCWNGTENVDGTFDCWD
jgi:hypothetical protein